VNRRRWLSLLFTSLAVVGCDARGPQITAVPPAANEDAWIEGQPFRTDFAAALDEAVRDQKPLLIYFTADWCTYCRQLRRDVFDRSEFRNAAKNFVCVRVDADRRPELAAEYRVRAFPTMVLAGPGGTAIERIVGLTTPTALLTQMRAAATSVVAAVPDTTTLQR